MADWRKQLNDILTTPEETEQQKEAREIAARHRALTTLTDVARQFREMLFEAGTTLARSGAQADRTFDGSGKTARLESGATSVGYEYSGETPSVSVIVDGQAVVQLVCNADDGRVETTLGEPVYDTEGYFGGFITAFARKCVRR